MGIFDRLKKGNKKGKDMSADAQKQQFIDQSIASQRQAEPIPTSVTPELSPPPSPKDNFSGVEKQKSDEEKINALLGKTIQSEDGTLKGDIKVTMVIRVRSSMLLSQLLDGVSEIVETNPSDVLDEFRVEKWK